MRKWIIIGAIAAAFAYWAHDGLWYLFNIAMRNEAFADSVALAGVVLVLWSVCWAVSGVVSGRWLR